MDCLFAISTDEVAKLLKDPHVYIEFLPNDPQKSVHMDAAGPVLQYLMKKYSGKSGNLGNLILALTGGKEAGVDLTGEAIFRYLEPDEVAEIAQRLNNVKFEDLWQNTGIDELLDAGIGGIQEDANIEDEFKYAKHYYEKLIDIYKIAADKRYAMVLM